MSELEFELTDVDPQNFFSRDNLNSLKSSFPKLKLVQRGQTIKALGEKSELKLFDNKFITKDLKGLEFNPIFKKWKKSDNLSVNYIICSSKN